MFGLAPRRSPGARRRATIIDAAITVIAEHGVEAMSHRRVAKAAGVPLAATTYYFASLDELRTEALDQIVRRDLSAMKRHFENLGDSTELAAVLGTVIYEWLGDREASVVTVEIFASAMRRDSVRDIARAWERAWINALEPRIGPIPALAAVSAAFGYVQHALLQEETPSLDELIAVMRQVLH